MVPALGGILDHNRQIDGKTAFKCRPLLDSTPLSFLLGAKVFRWSVRPGLHRHDDLVLGPTKVIALTSILIRILKSVLRTLGSFYGVSISPPPGGQN